jgi:hypothetical protein
MLSLVCMNIPCEYNWFLNEDLDLYKYSKLQRGQYLSSLTLVSQKPVLGLRGRPRSLYNAPTFRPSCKSSLEA